MFSQPSDFMSQEGGPGVVFVEGKPKVSEVAEVSYQPEDFESMSGPGVVFMREPRVIQPSFQDSPAIFMVADKPTVEFQRPGQKGSTEIKDIPPSKRFEKKYGME